MDTLSSYYSSLQSVKILSKEEEKKNFLLFKKGDMRAGQLLVESCLRLVFSMSKKYWTDNDPETLKDLISCGNLGLLKALTKFDVNKDVKFITYGAYWVLMFIRKYLVEDSKVVKPPIKVRRSSKLKDLPPSNLVYREASSYKQIKDTSPTPEESIILHEEEENREQVLETLLSYLPSRERFIIDSSCGLSEQKPRSLNSISESLGISSERVRQLRESSLEKLSLWSTYYKV